MSAFRNNLTTKFANQQIQERYKIIKSSHLCWMKTVIESNDYGLNCFYEKVFVQHKLINWACAFHRFGGGDHGQERNACLDTTPGICNNEKKWRMRRNHSAHTAKGGWAVQCPQDWWQRLLPSQCTCLPNGVWFCVQAHLNSSLFLT